MEEQDPQDAAVLSNDMADPVVEQRTVTVRSVYEGLVEIAKTHGKIYRTNGKHADMLRFDLTAHSVFVGNAFIVSRGTLNMPVVETAAIKVDMTGLPWLTPSEQTLNPEDLFRDHYLSRPNGTEKYIACNFRAKDTDEMTDDEIARGLPRNEARVHLEAWMLCAALDGTLERYVTSQPNWKDGNWWWSRSDGGQCEPELVIKTDWWRKAGDKTWNLVENRDGSCSCTTHEGRPVLLFAHGTDNVTCRTVQSAETLFRLAKSLSQEAFKMQMRTKCYELDPIICEVNRLVEYIETGRIRLV